MNSIVNVSRYMRVSVISAAFFLVATGCGLNSSLDTGEAAAISLDEEASSADELCGNGKIDKGEQCDKKELGGATCKSLGEGSGELECGPACFFDVSVCEGPDVNDAGSTSTPYGTTGTDTAITDFIRTLFGGDTGTNPTGTGTAGTTATNPWTRGTQGTAGTTATNPWTRGTQGTAGTAATNPWTRGNRGTAGTTATNPWTRGTQGTAGTTATNPWTRGTQGTGTTATNPWTRGTQGTTGTGTTTNPRTRTRGTTGTTRTRGGNTGAQTAATN